MLTAKAARYGYQAVGLWLAFAGSVALSVLLSRHGGAGAALWTANGFLAGALIILPKPWNYWVLGLCAVSQVGISLLAGDSLIRVLCVTPVSLIQCVLAAVLALRFCGVGARRLGMTRLSRLFVFSIIPAAVAGGFLAAVVRVLVFHADFLETWRDWLISGGLGLAVVLPGVLLATRFAQYRDFRRSWTEVVSLFAGLAILTFAVFIQSELPVFFAIFPAVTLIAFRLGPPGAAVAGFVVGVIALPLTLLGHGPAMLADHLDFAGRVRLTQGFVGAVLFTGGATAGALADQTRLRRLLVWRDQSARNSRLRAQEAERMASLFGAATVEPDTRLRMRASDLA